MKLAIMQPYFFPYIGYFQLIARTDKWIVFDIVQYNSKSWMNRNRILHPDSGWQYIKMPVKKTPKGTPLCDIDTIGPVESLKKIKAQLLHYKKHAPYYCAVIDLIDSVEIKTSTRLVDLNVQCIKVVCDYIGVNFNYEICSKMDLDLKNIEHPGQWALEISRQTGATEYINLPGGKELFDEAEWSDASIKLSIMELNDFSYKCSPYEFIPNLSIIDVLMWNSPESIKQSLII